ncbi:MAG: hypothetical protein HFG49_14685 [Lachnospiraceae bacterium]|nr:hypothetical protein [Lachnospiraceae bacterium]
MRKSITTLIGTMIVSAAFATVAFAGEWRKDDIGLWWENDDGSRLTSCWKWLDGDRDGSAQCFYFGQDGYAAVNAEIDGFRLNEKGAWEVNGVVQNRNLSTNNSPENRKAKAAYKQFLEQEEQRAVSNGNNNLKGMFHILDINQDGLDELLYCELPYFGFGLDIYTFYGGKMTKVSEEGKNEGLWYDRINKGLQFNVANNGYYSKWITYFNGTEWVTDSASYDYNDWIVGYDEPFLLFTEFCQLMITERPDMYGNGENMEEKYLGYKTDWEEMNAFEQRYANGLAGYQDDAGWIEGTENNRENRSRVLD